MTDPYLTETALAFDLACDGRPRKFLISLDALDSLGKRHGFSMDHLNLYRAHEALIHVVARFMAMEDQSGFTLFIDVGHFKAACAPAAASPPQMQAALHAV